MLTAMIDGDILMYRICFTIESETKIEKHIDEYMTNLLDKTGCNQYIGILGIHGSNNLKYTLYPDYKRGRPKDKPPYWNMVMNYLISKWQFTCISGCETDDALALCMEDTPIGEQATIVSSDKDMLGVPGMHYRLGITRRGVVVKKDEIVFVSNTYAKRHFYLQMLTGDSVDNVKGCPGIGPKTANKILDNCRTEWQMFIATCRLYKIAYQEKWQDMFVINKALLKITGLNARLVRFQRPKPVFYKESSDY